MLRVGVFDDSRLCGLAPRLFVVVCTRRFGGIVASTAPTESRNPRFSGLNDMSFIFVGFVRHDGIAVLLISRSHPIAAIPRRIGLAFPDLWTEE